MLFIAVALFGMLAFAFLQGSRTGTSWLTNERDKASATESQDCTNALNMAMKRLEARGCGDLISSEADGSNPNPNAPTDGSCSIYHTNGGGIKCVAPTSVAACTTTVIGDTCPDGTIYAGISPDGSNRMYTTPSDASSGIMYDTTNYVNTALPDCGGSGCNTGASNTATLAALGPTYAAAALCAALTSHGHDDWYLPSLGELDVLVDNESDIGNFDSSGAWPQGYYWSSSEENSLFAWVIQLGTGSVQNREKWYSFSIRCVRKD